MLYRDEVKDPSRFSEIRGLHEAGEEELALGMKIIDKLTVDLDLSVFHDGYNKERKVTLEEEKKPKKQVANSMMEALRRRRNH